MDRPIAFHADLPRARPNPDGSLDFTPAQDPAVWLEQRYAQTRAVPAQPVHLTGAEE